jgi:hypothetical protein
MTKDIDRKIEELVAKRLRAQCQDCDHIKDVENDNKKLKFRVRDLEAIIKQVKIHIEGV